MLDKFLRPVKDRALEPLARSLGSVLSPIALTGVGLAAGLMAGLFAFRAMYVAAAAFWLLNRFVDGLDGVVARAHNRQTDFGGYLDILADFVVYAVIPAAVVLGMSYDPGAYLALIALLGSFYVNAASWMYLAAILERRGRGADFAGERTTVTMPDGLIGGSETVIAYLVFLLFSVHATILFASMAVLVAATVVQRVVWASRNL